MTHTYTARTVLDALTGAGLVDTDTLAELAGYCTTTGDTVRELVDAGHVDTFALLAVLDYDLAERAAANPDGCTVDLDDAGDLTVEVDA